MPNETSNILNNITEKWPAIKNISNLVIKPDTSFTREKTGEGDIETFQPKYNVITYSNGFKYSNPNPGGNAVVYNPKTNNQDNIQLDLLHTMRREDPIYIKHLSEFENAYKNSENADRVKYWWNKSGANKLNDGYNEFFNNEVDASLRNLLAPQSDEELVKQNYLSHKDAEKETLITPELIQRFGQLKNYLETGKGYVLPEVMITPNNTKNTNIMKLIPKNKKGGSSKNWIQKAVNPAHKGYCTPMSKSTCTPRRKALARTFKKMAKHELGGSIAFLMPLIDQFKKGGALTKDYIKKAHEKPGGSNVGKKKFASGAKRTGPYIGPSGGSPKGSYPIPTREKAISALKLAHHAPNPEGIKAAVYRKYPELKK